jgi:hypothetical protein
MMSIGFVVVRGAFCSEFSAEGIHAVTKPLKICFGPEVDLAHYWQLQFHLYVAGFVVADTRHGLEMVD